jgi:Flp pilus assembly protein TadG
MARNFISSPIARRIASQFGRLRRDASGNILMMTAIGLTTLCFAFGFVVDFSRAEAEQTELSAIADAAALAAVDPSMIYQSNAAAQAAATAMWNSQVALIQGLTGVTMTPTVTTGTGIGGLRNVQITWTANSTNIFANFLGVPSLALAGSSSAAASQPPNINFYVVVDNSPSMLIPDSASGVSLLQGTTSTNLGGCAFTCHNRKPQTMYAYEVINSNSGSTKNYAAWIPDSPYTSPSMTGSQYYMWVNPSSTSKVYDPGNHQLSKYTVCPGSDNTTATSVSMATTASGCSGTTISGQWADGYWVAENYSLVYPSAGVSKLELRIDDASNAVQALGPYAYNLSTTNNATYALQEFFYNSAISDPQNLYPALPAGASQIAGTAVVQMTGMTTLANATSFTPPTIPVTRWVDSLCMTSLSCPNVSGGDTTDNPSMLTEMNTLMPNPGTGQTGSTPQEILFLITDGYDDMYGSNRGPLTTAELAQCSAIKARGIKIAIIYTQYLSSSILPAYPSYATVLTPTDQVAAALQSCASTNASGNPLYYQVTQNQSIVPALQQLFAAVVQSAYLVQ